MLVKNRIATCGQSYKTFFFLTFQKSSVFSTLFTACRRALWPVFITHIVIINDISRVIRITIVSDATTKSITYDHN